MVFRAAAGHPGALSQAHVLTIGPINSIAAYAGRGPAHYPAVCGVNTHCLRNLPPACGDGRVRGGSNFVWPGCGASRAHDVRRRRKRRAFPIGDHRGQGAVHRWLPTHLFATAARHPQFGFVPAGPVAKRPRAPAGSLLIPEPEPFACAATAISLMQGYFSRATVGSLHQACSFPTCWLGSGIWR